jgi:hypothetical protein
MSGDGGHAPDEHRTAHRVRCGRPGADGKPAAATGLHNQRDSLAGGGPGGARGKGGDQATAASAAGMSLAYL